METQWPLTDPSIHRPPQRSSRSLEVELIPFQRCTWGEVEVSSFQVHLRHLLPSQGRRPASSSSKMGIKARMRIPQTAAQTLAAKEPCSEQRLGWIEGAGKLRSLAGAGARQMGTRRPPEREAGGRGVRQHWGRGKLDSQETSEL